MIIIPKIPSANKVELQRLHSHSTCGAVKRLGMARQIGTTIERIRDQNKAEDAPVARPRNMQDALDDEHSVSDANGIPDRDPDTQESCMP